MHLSGVAHLREHEENRGHGDALLAVSEARLPKQPWDLAQMEPGKREAMLAGIRVIDLVVDEIEGQSKLNQHKSDADYVALVNRLAQAAETASRRLAEKMRALRPGLAYDDEIVVGQRVAPRDRLRGNPPSTSCDRKPVVKRSVRRDLIPIPIRSLRTKWSRMRNRIDGEVEMSCA